MTEPLNHDWQDIPTNGIVVTSCKKCFVQSTAPPAKEPCGGVPITEQISPGIFSSNIKASPLLKASDYFKQLNLADLDTQIADLEGELEALRILRDAVKARDERKSK